MLEKVSAASYRHRIGEDAEIHGAIAAARQDPAFDLLDEAVDGLRPEGVSDHDVARARWEPANLKGFGKSLPELIEIALRHGPGKKKPIILIGPEGLLAAAFGTHDHKASVLLDRSRRCELENFRNQSPIEV